MLPDSTVTDELLIRRGYMAVLCDGMSGLSGGEIASRVCVEMLMGAYYGEREMEPCEFYQSILTQVDKAIAGLADNDGRLFSCGTTLASIIIRDQRLYWASVGDSRVYLFRQGRLFQLSRDHNYLLYLMQAYEEHKISELDLLLDERAHALISYIGMDGLVLKDIKEEYCPLEKGDIAMICSDGLYRALRDEEIEAVLRAYSGRPAELPAILTQLACGRDWMLHDNVSAAIVAVR